MALTRRQIDRLIQAIKSHTDWLYSTLAGVELSAAELAKIKQFNLPLDLDVDLIKNGYALGLLRMLRKRSEYVDTSLEELVDAAKSERTPVESLAIQQAMLTSGKHIKNLAEDIGNQAFDQIVEASGKALTEATITGVVKDTVAYGLIKRKNYMQVATDLASNLKTDWRRDWRMVAETELHKAKVQGMVQALVNKKDVYKYSEGVDSHVSVVPAPDKCADCHTLYLDKEGNPKVFRLSWLIAQGSNGDPGTNHSKSNGVHIHWKVTLPPAHPRCGCSLVYVPVGYGWVEGRLVLIDKDAYKASMRKGMDLSKAKEYTPFSPTAKPMGPASVKAEEPNMGSLPGVDSPAKAGTPTAGGSVKAPKAGGVDPHAETQTDGNKQDSQICPLGEADCVSHGGSGKHHPGSAMLLEHQQILANGKGAPAEEQVDPNQRALDMSQSAHWQKQPHAPSVIAKQLSSAEVINDEKIQNDGTGGITAPHKLSFKGGGDGCFKAERSEPLGLLNYGNVPIAEALGVTAENTGHKREVASYQHAASYGESQVPVTVYRTHEGQEGSVQHWLGESKSAASDIGKMDDDQAEAYKIAGTVNYAKYMMEQADDKPQALEEVSRSIVHDVMKAHTDRHNGNLRYTVKDGKLSIHTIDNADSFGRGLELFRNDAFSDLASSGHKVVIPEDLSAKMRLRSFGDEERSISGHVSKKEAAETFIRTKYALHLQDTEGHLDYRHFICYTKDEGGNSVPHPRDAKRRGAKKLDNLLKTEGTPHDKYMKFEAEYVKKMEDPSHPHHADVERVKAALSTQDRSEFTPQQTKNKQLQLLHSETKSGMAAWSKLQEDHKARLKAKYESPKTTSDGTATDQSERTIVGNSMDSA